MTDKKSNDSRRKLLKSIAAGSGALVAGKSLPKSWSKPVINTVLLPAHAETSDATTYSQTQGFEDHGTRNPAGDNSDPLMLDQTLTFSLGGLTPIDDGTVTISNLAGDLDDSPDEVWTIMMNGVVLGSTKYSATHCSTAEGSVFDVTKAALLAAISGDSIEIKAVNKGGINKNCGDVSDNGESNRMDITLVFLAQA